MKQEVSKRCKLRHLLHVAFLGGKLTTGVLAVPKNRMEEQASYLNLAMLYQVLLHITLIGNFSAATWKTGAEVQQGFMWR